MTRFEGFGPGAREWFLGLEEDNSREYFSAHRAFIGEGIGRADGLRFVTRTWRNTTPVTGWLDQHVGATALTAGRRAR